MTVPQVFFRRFYQPGKRGTANPSICQTQSAFIGNRNRLVYPHLRPCKKLNLKIRQFAIRKPQQQSALPCTPPGRSSESIWTGSLAIADGSRVVADATIHRLSSARTDPRFKICNNVIVDTLLPVRNPIENQSALGLTQSLTWTA